MLTSTNAGSATLYAPQFSAMCSVKPPVGSKTMSLSRFPHRIIQRVRSQPHLGHTEWRTRIDDVQYISESIGGLPLDGFIVEVT